MLNTDIVRNGVFKIILVNNNSFKNNEQYCFACGVASTALLYSIDYSDDVNTAIYEELLNSHNLTEFMKEMNALVEKNLSYVEQQSSYKRNLFNYIINYVPGKVNSLSDYKEYFIYGTLNSVFYFESDPVTIKEYAQLHYVTPSTIRYHIDKNNLKSAKKIGRNIFIQKDEPYPVKHKK